jgi:hypothetical protein
MVAIKADSDATASVFRVPYDPNLTAVQRVGKSTASSPAADPGAATRLSCWLSQPQGNG